MRGNLTPWVPADEALHDGALMRVDIELGGLYGLELEALGLPDDCAVQPASFEACGGELAGEWELEGRCYAELHLATYPMPSAKKSVCRWDNPSPFEGELRELRAEGVDEWPMSANLTIDDTRWVRSTAQAAIPLVTRIGVDCYWDPVTCVELGMALFGAPLPCSDDGDLCDCELPLPQTLVAVDASYQASGSQLTLAGGEALDYCVQGERLRIREQTDAGIPVVTVYRRR